MSTMLSPASAKERSVRRGLGLTLLALAAVAGIFYVRQVRSRVPTLDAALDRAHAGDLDGAAAAARAVLASHPDYAPARVLLAQVLVGRQGPAGETAPPADTAEEALALLDPLRPTNDAMEVAAQLCRGRAFDRLNRLDEAEAAWVEALRIDPRAPEAGFHLLNLYYLQWREDDARKLAIRLSDTEPDPHDRALLLLELIRPDARPPAPGSLIKFFEPIVEAHPRDLHSAKALGLAMVRAGRIDDGMALLRRVAVDHPGRIEAWDTLLTGLDESGEVAAMEDQLGRVPPELADSPILLKHRARIVTGGRWKETVDLYRRARHAEPFNRVVEYRLSRALRHVSEDALADRIKERVGRRDVAIQELRPLFDRALDVPGLDLASEPDLCRAIAEARERMQLPEEAAAWYRLVLSRHPDDEASRHALAMLDASRGRSPDD